MIVILYIPMISYCSCKIVSGISLHFIIWLLPFLLLPYCFFILYSFVFLCISIRLPLQGAYEESQFSLASRCGHTAKLLWVFLFLFLLVFDLFQRQFTLNSWSNFETNEPIVFAILCLTTVQFLAEFCRYGVWFSLVNIRRLHPHTEGWWPGALRRFPPRSRRWTAVCRTQWCRRPAIRSHRVRPPVLAPMVRQLLPLNRTYISRTILTTS